MERLENLLECISSIFDIVEQFLLGLVAKTATWLSPMVPAMFVYSSVLEHFPALPGWGAYLTAYVIEALGLTTIFNTMEGWQHYQKEHTKTNGWIFFIALITALFYVLLNILLVIVLKVYPDLAQWATGLLSSLSVVAGISTVMRIWQSSSTLEVRRGKRKTEREQHEAGQREIERQQREFDLEMERQRLEMEAKLEAERLKLTAKLQSKSAKSAAPNSVEKSVEKHLSTLEKGENSTGKKAKIQQRRNMIFQHIKMNGDPGPTALSQQFDVDRGTIYGDLKAMEKAGIVHQNGAGWTPGPAKEI